MSSTTPSVLLSDLLLPAGWFVVLLAAPGLLILGAVVVAFLLHRPAPPAKGGRGAGYYHVLGFDEQTNAPREVTFHAESEAGARGRAQMDGMVVTEVTPVTDERGEDDKVKR